MKKSFSLKRYKLLMITIGKRDEEKDEFRVFEMSALNPRN